MADGAREESPTSKRAKLDHPVQEVLKHRSLLGTSLKCSSAGWGCACCQLSRPCTAAASAETRSLPMLHVQHLQPVRRGTRSEAPLRLHLAMAARFCPLHLLARRSH